MHANIKDKTYASWLAIAKHIATAYCKLAGTLAKMWLLLRIFGDGYQIFADLHETFNELIDLRYIVSQYCISLSLTSIVHQFFNTSEG